MDNFLSQFLCSLWGDDLSPSSGFGVRSERLCSILVRIVNLKQTIHICHSQYSSSHR